MMAKDMDGLPHDERFERTVIGALILYGSEIAADVFSAINASDFYYKKHRIIFENALIMATSGVEIDILTLSKQLEESGDMADAGGTSYLSDCAEITVSSANIMQHCAILSEYAVERRAAENSVRAQEILQRGDLTHNEKIIEIRSCFMEIFEGRTKTDFDHISNHVTEIIEDWENRSGDKDGIIDGIPTGYRELDEATLGWQPCDSIIIAANTSVGKSTLALNFAVNAARKGYPVGLFSLEMSTKQNVIRIMSYYARINGHKARYGKMPVEDWERLSGKADSISKLPIYIDESSSLTTMDILAKARRLINDYGAKMFVIDYIQKVHGVKKYQGLYEELTDVSDRIKAIAKELSVPIITVSQFNRGGADNEKMSKIKGSGGIEQDADIVMILKPLDVMRDTYRLDMEKHRNGPTTFVDLLFDKKCLTFLPLEDEISDMNGTN
jgi:replicative DNA helicase